MFSKILSYVVSRLTFDVVLEYGSVVVPSWRDGKSGGGVGLSALVARDHLNLAGVDVAGLGHVEVPHTVVHQLVAASLKGKKGSNFGL